MTARPSRAHMIPTVEDLPEIVTADPPMLEEKSAEEDKPRSSRKFDFCRYMIIIWCMIVNLICYTSGYRTRRKTAFTTIDEDDEADGGIVVDNSSNIVWVFLDIFIK